MILQNPHWSQISSCRYGEWRNQKNLILHHRHLSMRPPRRNAIATASLNEADFLGGVASNKVRLPLLQSIHFSCSNRLPPLLISHFARDCNVLI